MGQQRHSRGPARAPPLPCPRRPAAPPRRSRLRAHPPASPTPLPPRPTRRPLLPPRPHLGPRWQPRWQRQAQAEHLRSERGGRGAGGDDGLRLYAAALRLVPPAPALLPRASPSHNPLSLCGLCEGEAHNPLSLSLSLLPSRTDSPAEWCAGPARGGSSRAASSRRDLPSSRPAAARRPAAAACSPASPSAAAAAAAASASGRATARWTRRRRAAAAARYRSAKARDAACAACAAHAPQVQGTCHWPGQGRVNHKPGR